MNTGAARRYRQERRCAGAHGDRRIDASVLSKAGDKLKLIANYGNGVDHIDVATALSRGITVTTRRASLPRIPPT